VLAIRVVAGGAIAIFALSTPGFTSPLSINALLNAISFIGCVAVGMTFITITGNIMSLCLGATVSASALIFLASLSFGVLPAFLVAILFGSDHNCRAGSAGRLHPSQSHPSQHRRPFAC
jgi:ribose/xylose/arabinose/galactoside ABC-type transport system permease subunit